MADLKKLLRQGILPQVFIALIAIVGVSQLVNSLSASAGKGTESAKTGPRGATGPKGDKGDTGAAGPKGDTGETGTTGATGKSGATGTAGQKGEQGVAGSPGATGAAGAQGATGATGPTGPAGTFSASYGQLSLSGVSIDMRNPDEWLPIPFSTVGPSSNATVSTTSPAKITVQKSGAYQVSMSLYILGEAADEGWFVASNYKLGLKINGGATTTVATLHVDEAGRFSLNHSNIIELSANDTVQFHIASSDADSPPFTNYITLENGNAYLMQISD